MSIQNEIDRINNNVQATLQTIADTGVSVGTNSDALPAAASALANEKANVDHTHNYLPLSGGYLTGNVTLSNGSSAQSGQPHFKWKTVGANTPYIGFAQNQTDGTFILGGLKGVNYQDGLAIGGGSGNLLWKGVKVATTSDIPSVGNGTVTIKQNGETKGSFTLNQSGNATIELTDEDTTYSAATTSAAGLMSASDKSKLDGIAAGANKYTHPSYTAKSSGFYKVTVDSTGHVSGTAAVKKSDITDLGIPAQDTTYSAATTSAAGLMSAADKSKIDNLPTVLAFYGVALTFTNNQATFSDSRIKANSVVVCSRRAGSAQNNIFSVNPTAGSVTISSPSTSGTINVNMIIVNN